MVPSEPAENGLLVFTSLAIAGVAAHAAGPWAGGFGWLFFLIPLFWIALFVLFFAFVGRRWRRAAWEGHGRFSGRWAEPSRSAETTLAERFAQGDIDEKEYRARLEVLRANRIAPEPPR